MSKVFIVAQQGNAHTDTISEGMKLANVLNKQAEVFAYCYEYFSGAEYYNPRLAAVAQQALMKRREEEVREQLKHIDASEIPLHLVWSKSLYEHACHHSARHGFDMIIKGIDNKEHYLPIDWHLIRHTQVPLMLLCDNPLNKANTILMAVDLDASNPQKQSLNDFVVEQAKMLANATGAELHLAHVIRVPPILRDMDVINIHEVTESAHQKHADKLKALGLAPENIHLIAGDPELCLFELSCRLKSRYLVIGARQRQGLLGYVLGNTAEAILSRMRSNVLVVPKNSMSES